MEKMAHFFPFKTSKDSGVNLQNTTKVALLLGILLLAAFLRLYKIDGYMTFLGDEGRDVLVVRDIIQGAERIFEGDFAGAKDKFTLLGPTASVGGFFLGPIYYYFMAPFLWIFNFNPVGPAVMVGLFGIATVWLIYKVASEFFNQKAGLAAALLYTISPLIIGYSRSSWNPNLMPFFSLLTLYILYKAVKRRKLWLFLVCGVFLGVAMQLHYLATFLGVVIGFYIILVEILSGYCSIGSIKIKKLLPKIIKRYTVLFFGFLVGLSPFLAFEVRHNFPNITSIIHFVFTSGDTGSNSMFFSILENVFFRLFGRLVTKFPPPEQVSLNDSVIPIDLFIVTFTTHIFFLYAVTSILAVGSIGLLAFVYTKAIKERNLQNLQKYSLFVVWFFLGVSLFGFYKKPIYDYYFGFLFPLPFLLVGNFFSKLWEQQKSVKIVSIGFFFLLVLFNLAGAPFRYTPNRQLAQVKQIAQFILDKTDGKPFNFALITGGNSDHGYRYFFALAEKDAVTIENSQIDPKRITVTNQLLVVCEEHPCHPLGHPLWEIAGFGRAEVASEWDVAVVRVYKLIHYSPH